MMSKEETLLLENQICFPLYAASRLVTKLYQPLLKELDITYPQYLVLLVLWEKERQTVSQLSEQLFLESNTLTPMLKRLEAKGIVTRKRKTNDERVVEVSITAKGEVLKSKAECIPEQLWMKLNPEGNGEKARKFKKMLEELIQQLR